MEQVPEKRWGKFGWIVAASVAVHLIVAALLFARLPDQETPEKEEAVNVDLVPPPEEKKPEEKAPQKAPEPPHEKKAEKAPEPPPPAPTPEKQEGQQAPPPQPPQEKAEEKKAEPPPPPPKPEEKPPEPPKEAKTEEPPKPAEPQKGSKAEEPPKPEEQPDEKPEDKQPSALSQTQEQAPSPPLTALQRAVQFGDKDSGPRKSPDGDSMEDSQTDTDEEPDSNAADPSAAAPAMNDAVPTTPDAKVASASPVAKDIDLPQVNADDIHSENDGPKAQGTGTLNTAFATEKHTEEIKQASNAQPTDKTAASASGGGRASSGPKLKVAKSLFSTHDTSAGDATTAMADIPKDVRFAMLCRTELEAQLVHGSPSYHPGIVTLAKPKGNVMSVDLGAFRDANGWRDMSFKCEVDSNATKIVSFAFGVGNPVPRSQWRNRGFPE